MKIIFYASVWGEGNKQTIVYRYISISFFFPRCLVRISPNGKQLGGNKNRRCVARTISVVEKSTFVARSSRSLFNRPPIIHSTWMANCIIIITAIGVYYKYKTVNGRMRINNELTVNRTRVRPHGCAERFMFIADNRNRYRSELHFQKPAVTVHSGRRRK